MIDPKHPRFRLGAALLAALCALLLFRTCRHPEAQKLVLSGEGFAVNGQRYPGLSDLSDPETLWGKARRVEGTINDLLIWDRRGLCVFSESGTGRIVSLHIALIPSGESNRPSGPFHGSLTIGSLELAHDSLPEDLTGAGFRALGASGWYKQTLGNTRVSVFNENGQLKTVELSPLGES